MVRARWVFSMGVLALMVIGCGSEPQGPSLMTSEDGAGWPPGAKDAARIGDAGHSDQASTDSYVSDVTAADTAIADTIPSDFGLPDSVSDAAPLDAAVDLGQDLPEDLAPDGPLDSDGDGVPDVMDNCPFVASADHTDTDQDGQGDVCDDDDDNDGFDDEADCDPLNDAIHPDAEEICDDADNDCDGTVDENPVLECGELGVCADGVTTACVDGEAVCNVEDIGTWCSYDLCDGLDNDCDGDTDEADFDICCDCDWDNGPPAWYTVCDPAAANPDDDGDGVDDVTDNCPLVPNGGQENSDGDDHGDACDVDDDNDGTVDEKDCAPTDASIHPGANESCNGVDDDCDGEVDEALGTINCGVGQCTNKVTACVDGVPQECLPLDMASEEVCDLVDNDCDGDIDEDLPNVTCGVGACFTILPGCVAGEVPECVPESNQSPEVCDGVDNDCNGETDESLGTLTCGEGPCVNTVAKCANGQEQECAPLPPPDGTCDAAAAPCKTTTYGLDACGNECSKVGPSKCYIVHSACLTSNPGTLTDQSYCVTPKDKYNCGLTCEAWPNSIGADCTYCVNIYCLKVNGPDIAQFKCNNLPAPPTE